MSQKLLITGGTGFIGLCLQHTY